MIKNADPKKNPVTTSLGVIMTLLSIIIFTAPMFFTVKKDFTEMWYIPTGIGAIGLLLILSPDTLVRGANKGVDKLLDDKAKKEDK